ncbi:MAG: sialidase family protein, partial [Acidobacteriota bacterium]
MKKQLLIIFCLAVVVFAAACAKRSSTPPTNFGSPQRISSGEANASEPAIATAKDGTAYVAWVEHRGKEADVMLRRFKGTGEPLGDPVRINPQAGQATAWRGDPPTVALAADGTVCVGWTGRADPASGISPDIYLSASRDGGQSFAAPVKVNDDQKPA